LYVYFKEGIKLIKNYLSLFIVATQVFMLTREIKYR